MKLRSILIALLIISLSAILITFTDELTQAPIAKAKLNQQKKRILEMMPLSYNNDLYKDKIEIRAVGEIGSTEAIQIYRAKRQSNSTEQPVGLVIILTSVNGYNGPIKLALSLNAAGQVLKTHILEHQESKDFGSKIHQDQTDWLMKFKRISTENVNQKTIDQITGASISSGAVTDIITNCLRLYKQKPALFWATTNQ